MRILVAHNYYGSSAPSGENMARDAETKLLVQRGHEVSEFSRHSDEIRGKGAWGALQGAAAVPWNPWMTKAIQRQVEELRPDVVHVHNTFPLISPAIFHAIGKRAAKVLTLHNFRLFCASAVCARNGCECTECLDQRSSLPALRHGCYRGSRAATLPLAASIELHRHLRTWDHVDAFIALTEFQREIVVRAGLPADRVHVDPPFFGGNHHRIPWGDRSDRAVFAGRLTADKGIETLVQAWKDWGADAPELLVLGDGPLRKRMEAVASPRITFLGQVAANVAHAEIARSKLLVLPSRTFETFGMAVLEAFASGTPAAVSNIGPLPTIVKRGVSGIVFSPGDPQSLLSEIRASWASLPVLAAGALSEFERLYTEDAHYQKLLSIYGAAVALLH